MRSLIFLMLVCVSNFAQAQLEITFPQSRQIFQRNNANYAIVQIAGNYTQPVTRVEARLVALQGGSSTDWQVVQDNPSFGYFRGNISVAGGWYRLEVRGSLNGQVIGTTSVDKMGVGEVFVIAGQSNAQGFEDSTYDVGAADDRVNCVSNYYSFGSISDPPYPQISQLAANVQIAPFGDGAWCWGQLGDLLAQRLNVPILFMNAAWAAMSSVQWKLSSDGQAGYNQYTNSYAPPGFPYGNLQKSLQYYCSIFGIRAILWHQGETDNDDKTSTQDYKNNLEYVITKTRVQTGKNISWMVARASHIATGNYQPVIDGQNLTIQQVSNVFAGPSTDSILDRTDGVHFNAVGLSKAAKAWNNSMDANFFANATYQPAASLLSIQSFCNSGDATTPIRLSVSTGYAYYSWNTGSGQEFINVRAGRFSAIAKDNLGNTFFLPAVRFDEPIFSATPTISANGSTNLCPGNSVTLSSNYDLNNYWSNGTVNKSINVNSAGDYSVTYVNLYGCVSTSPSVSVRLLPQPTASIVANGTTTFCSDKSVILTSSSQTNNVWSNGATSQSIVVNQTGNYSVTIANEFGCRATSNVIATNVAPEAPLPLIAADGATTFCADKSVRIFTNLPNNITWSNGSTSSSIIVNQTGDYFVTSTNSFGCTKTSSTISVKTNPLPAQPTIIADGTSPLCADKAINLTSSVATNNTWTTGSTAKTITVNQSGSYSVTSTNQFGCSQTSSPFVVKVNPLPTQPIVTASGPTIFCADDKVTLTSSPNSAYNWSDGSKTQSITVNLSGNYSLKVTDTNGCVSPASATTQVTVKALPTPSSIIQVGTYTLQETSSDFLTGQIYEWRLNDNILTPTTPKIKAKEGGNYTIRGSIAYDLGNGKSLTCYSVLSAPYLFQLDPNNRGVSIYPNPNTTGTINIETFDDLDNAAVTLYSMKGVIVNEFIVTKFDDRKTFNLHDLPKGQYLLQVKAANFNVTKHLDFE